MRTEARQKESDEINKSATTACNESLTSKPGQALMTDLEVYRSTYCSKHRCNKLIEFTLESKIKLRGKWECRNRNSARKEEKNKKQKTKQ
jgi:hypothetical protein